MFFLFLLLPEPIPMPSPEPLPAQFVIQVDSYTPYTLFINNQKIKANHLYRTQPIINPVCIEVQASYIDGDQIKKKTFYLDVEPGYKITYTITLRAKPTLMWCSNDSNTSEYAGENIDNQISDC